MKTNYNVGRKKMRGPPSSDSSDEDSDGGLKPGDESVSSSSDTSSDEDSDDGLTSGDDDPNGSEPGDAADVDSNPATAVAIVTENIRTQSQLKNIQRGKQLKPNIKKTPREPQTAEDTSPSAASQEIEGIHRGKQLKLNIRVNPRTPKTAEDTSPSSASQKIEGTAPSSDVSNDGERSPSEADDDIQSETSPSESDDDISLDAGGGNANQMQQAPPTRVVDATIRAVDKHETNHIPITASVLPLLLLQAYDDDAPEDDASNKFPTILSPPVNARGHLDFTKLNAQTSKNMYREYIRNRSTTTGVIGSNIHVVLFCYTYDEEGTKDPNGQDNVGLISLCGEDSKFQDRIKIRPVSDDDWKRMWHWLMPEERFPEDGGQPSPKEKIMRKMGKLPLYGSIADLTEFVNAKTWKTDKIGADLKKKADDLISTPTTASKSDEENNCIRVKLRRVVQKMITHQLGMAAAVMDGLHRMVTVLCASNNIIPPPGTHGEFATAITAFSSALVPTESHGSGMGIKDESGETNNINAVLTLVEWVPPGQSIDPVFCKEMMHRSSIIQHNEVQADEHTPMHTVYSILKLLKENPSNVGFLFPSHQNNCPMTKALRLDQGSPHPTHEERYQKVETFLRETNISPSTIEKYLLTIEDNKKALGKCYTNYFSMIYTQLWIEDTARHLHKTLVNFWNDDKNPMRLMYPDLELEKLLEMDDEAWLKIFTPPVRLSKSQSPSLKCCAHPSITYLSTLSDTKKCPYKPSYGRSEQEQKNYSMRSYEFLWTLLWAHLTENTFDRYQDLFHGAKTETIHPAFPQEHAAMKHITRSLTCLVQTVACSVHSCSRIWKDGLGLNSEGRYKEANWKHSQPALLPLVFVKAMDGAIAFVARMGFNPVYHEYLRVKNSPSMNMVSNHVTDALGTDLMLLCVIAFVAQMAHFNDAVDALDKVEREDAMKQILKRHFEKTHGILLEDKGKDDWRAGFMKEKDLRDVVALININEQSVFTTKGGNEIRTDPFTHSIEKVMQAQVGDWKQTSLNEVKTGPFFHIEYIKQLLKLTKEPSPPSQATQSGDTTVHSGKAESGRGNEKQQEEPSAQAQGAAPAAALAPVGTQQNTEKDNKKRKRHNRDTDGNVSRRKRKKKGIGPWKPTTEWLSAREKLYEFACFDAIKDDHEEEREREKNVDQFKDDLVHDDGKLYALYDVVRPLLIDHDKDNEENEGNEEGKEGAGEDGHDDDSEGNGYSGGVADLFDGEAQCDDGSPDEASEGGDLADDSFIDENPVVDGNDRSMHRALDNNPDAVQDFDDYLEGYRFNDEDSLTVPQGP